MIGKYCFKTCTYSSVYFINRTDKIFMDDLFEGCEKILEHPLDRDFTRMTREACLDREQRFFVKTCKSLIESLGSDVAEIGARSKFNQLVTIESSLILY